MKLDKTNIAFLNISTRLMVLAALERDWQLDYYPTSVGGETGIVRASKDSLSFSFKSTATSLSPIYGYFTAEDKVLTHSLLTGAGVSTPLTTEVRSTDDFNGFGFDFSNYKYVVKPTALNHGDGITIGVNSAKSMKHAVEFALATSGAETAIIQKQVDGKEYRFLVIEDKVVAVAGREPASVVGDGTLRIEELIQQKNDDPRRGEGHSASLTKIAMSDVIAARGESFLSKILNKGEHVTLLETSNLSKGGEAIDYTEVASDELKDLAVAAAKACSLGLAGVDIMTDDIVSPGNGKSFVIEVNLAPGIRMHHFPNAGEPRDVAGMIIEKLEENASSNRFVEKRIGVSSLLDFVGYKNLKAIPVRIDTGARTSSLWATDVKIRDGIASFKLFGRGSKWYTGKVVRRKVVEMREVTSSTGHVQQREVINMSIRMHGKRLNAKFTLSDRSTQSYPILIGRNTLRGNFLVDSGDPGEAQLYKYPEEADELKENEAI